MRLAITSELDKTRGKLNGLIYLLHMHCVCLNCVIEFFLITSYPLKARPLLALASRGLAFSCDIAPFQPLL